jgi:branched-chain amino acid transport system permease protein
MQTAFIVQTLLLSLTVAGLYAAIASGLALEFGVMRIINFAHGEFVMLGAFVTYFLNTRYGISPALGMLVAGLAMGALSLAVFHAFLARVLKQDEHNQILATLGLSILITNLAVILWTPDARALHAAPLLPTLHMGAVTVPGNNLFVLLIGVLLYVALMLFMTRTRYGVQLRLASDDPDLATLAGVNVERMFGLSFVIGGVTAGIAGGLVAVVLYVQPSVGADLVIRAFAIVALAGLGSIPGALVGAILLSLAEGLTSTFVPNGASWGYGVAFLIIVVVLLVRPTGLFGKEMRT